MRLMAFLEYALVVLGIAGMIAGPFFQVPNGFDFGVFLVGVGIALGGADSVMTRRVGFRVSDDSYQDYDGPPAVIIGLMALLVGAAIIGSAYLLSEGKWHGTVAALLRRPAAALIAAGFLVGCVGTLMMFNLSGRQGLAWMLLVRVPKTLLGLALLVTGLIAIALGAWEYFEPQAFDRLMRSVPPQLRRLAP